MKKYYRCGLKQYSEMKKNIGIIDEISYLIKNKSGVTRLSK
jgi:hypothetical protein